MENFCIESNHKILFLETYDQQNFYHKLGYQICPPVQVIHSRKNSNVAQIMKRLCNESSSCESPVGTCAKLDLDNINEVEAGGSEKSCSSVTVPIPPPPPPARRANTKSSTGNPRLSDGPDEAAVDSVGAVG